MYDDYSIDIKTIREWKAIAQQQTSLESTIAFAKMTDWYDNGKVDGKIEMMRAVLDKLGITYEI